MNKNIKRKFNAVRMYLRKVGIKTIRGYRMRNGLHLNFFSPEYMFGIQVEGMKKPKNLRQAEEMQNNDGERIRYCHEHKINLINISRYDPVREKLHRELTSSVKKAKHAAKVAKTKK